jgi:hypothetical protein
LVGPVSSIVGVFGMSDGRAAILMVLAAAVLLCPPTRGSQSHCDTIPHSHAFISQQSDSSIAYFLIRPPRPATRARFYPWVARLELVLAERSRNVVEDADSAGARPVVPPLRC